METSVIESTLKKIKQQEHGKEAKLKETRTLETTLAAMKRNLRDAIACVAKLSNDIVEEARKADAAEVELVRMQACRSALAAQLQGSLTELRHLKLDSENELLKVWQLRNKLCLEVQKVSDQCDIWALFTKPNFIESSNPSKRPIHEDKQPQLESILERTLSNRQNLLKERKRLLNEPDFGEEFKRIKNAIRYSEEMTAQAQTFKEEKRNRNVIPNLPKTAENVPKMSENPIKWIKAVRREN